MRFAILSVSRFATDALLEDIAAAIIVRGAETAAIWSPVYPDVVPPEVRCVSAVSELTDDDVPIPFTLTIDVPGNLAEHSVTGGYAWGLVLADEYQPADSIADAAIHEAVETMVDAKCDRSANGIDLEVADPVQGLQDPVRIPSGKLVSSSPIVTPAWFKLAAGPTVSNGYILDPEDVAPGSYYQRTDGTQRTAFGYRPAPHKFNPYSRAARRHTKRGGRVVCISGRWMLG